MDTKLRRTRAEELRPTVAGLCDVTESQGRGSRCLVVKAGQVALTSQCSMALRLFNVLCRFLEGLRAIVAESKLALSWWICGRSLNGSQGMKLLSVNESEVFLHSTLSLHTA